MPGRSFVGANGYRYGFNGKEKDDETSGNGNSYDYGFRIYNPRLGRFLSTDPLTRGYPMLTPYQFASNSPIDGIDLDGLEYLSANEARIKIVKGEVHVNVANFHSSTKSMWQQRDMACNNGTLRQPEGYIGGYPTKIGEASFDGMLAKNPEGLVEGMDAQKGDYTPDVKLDINVEFGHTSISAPNKKNGTPDMRFKGNKLNAIQGGINSAVPSAGGRLGGLAASLNSITWSLEQVAIFGALDDMQKLEAHKSLLFNQVTDDLLKALASDMIPKKFQNTEDMTAIANVILSGTNPTKNKEIFEVGINIVKEISENYRTPTTAVPTGGTSTDQAPIDNATTGGTIIIPTVK